MKPAAVTQAEIIRRIKAVALGLKATGQKIARVDITPGGDLTILAETGTQFDDEAERVGRLIEERMGG